MERLVIKSKAGSLYYNDDEHGVKLEPHEIGAHQRRLLLKRLYEYEDTGLTPEQIMELKARDTAKAPEEILGARLIWRIAGISFTAGSGRLASSSRAVPHGKERGRMRKILFWIVWNVPLGRLAPIVLGWALGVKGERIDDKEDKT